MDRWKVAKLRSECNKRKLSAVGVKNDLIKRLKQDDEAKINGNENALLESVVQFHSTNSTTTAWPTDMVKYLLSPLVGTPNTWDITKCDRNLDLLLRHTIEDPSVLSQLQDKAEDIDEYKRNYSVLYAPKENIAWRTVDISSMAPLFELPQSSDNWTDKNVKDIISILKGVASVNAQSEPELAEKYADFVRLWTPYASSRPWIMRELDPDYLIADMTAGPGGVAAAAAAYTPMMQGALGGAVTLNASNHAWVLPAAQDTHGFVRFVKGHILGAGAAQVAGYWHFTAMAAPPAYL